VRIVATINAPPLKLSHKVDGGVSEAFGHVLADQNRSRGDGS
jgi:hypothetical protein